jgi:hypothetical protein
MAGVPVPGWILPPWVVRGTVVVAQVELTVSYGPPELPDNTLTIAAGERARVLLVDEKTIRLYLGPEGGAEEWIGLGEPKEPYHWLDQQRSEFARAWGRLPPQETNNLGMADYVKTLTVGGVRFEQIGFYSRNPRLNIEPLRQFGTWSIIAFREVVPGKPQRVKWTHRGEWIDERIADPGAVFQTCELEYEVAKAVENLPGQEGVK